VGEGCYRVETESEKAAAEGGGKVNEKEAIASFHLYSIAHRPPILK
jgi:hypothetical protein